MPGEQRKLGFWSLMHDLFSLEKGLPQLWVFPALCCIFQCVIFGLFLWILFLLSPFFSLCCLGFNTPPLLYFPKSEQKFQINPRIETPLKTCQHKNVQIKGIVSHYILDVHTYHTLPTSMCRQTLSFQRQHPNTGIWRWLNWTILGISVRQSRY